MCGRYGLYDITDAEFLKENTGYDFKPNYNVAPTQTMPVVTEQGGKATVTVMQWGINRKLGPDIEKSIFNTRSEKALDRFWGRTVKTHRCLIPANGFYEWRKSAEGKIPFWIFAPSTNVIYFAGIFDEDSEENLHYSIMTTTPNAEMEKIHNRMPVILSREAQDAWLHTKETDAGLLSDLLRPLPDNSLEMFEVSKDVNIVHNNDGHLILPTNSK
jgi:putative SOS response-associated peptidase YedK